MKRILLAVILYTIILIDAAAQVKSPKVMVMGVPQYLFKNGIRIDVDLASKNPKNWWTISSQYYVDVSELGDWKEKDYEQMHGYGFAIYRKSFLTQKKPETGVYISGGSGYQHFNMLAIAERWVNMDDGGLQYMQLKRDYEHVYIHKFLTDAVIGFQTELFSHLYVDVYAGVGLRYSFHDQPSGLDIKFNNSSVDYGYTGTALIGGIRFGVGF
ncbi:MAG TPA: hypothetical protein VHO90_09925 [Bacteroidales bacterium]|nr:hypothetical protein [Bacteroidales bacterium]